MIKYLLRIEDDLWWREVKSLCAKKGITIRQFIINLLKKEILKGE